MTENIPQLETAERLADGRFTAGNTIGRRGGRPPREIEREYLTALRNGCPPERLEKIIGAVAAKAEKGNIEAARLLLGHALPPTTARLEIINDDVYRVAGVTPAENMTEMWQNMIAKVQRRRDYEAELRRSGVQFGPTDRESNGEASQKTT